MNIDKTPTTIQVGDYVGKNLVNAETATWVIGGSKPGVMTKRAKWAFERKEDADKYVKENGGEVANLDRAMQATYEDMYADTKMIREKRKMKRSASHQHQDSHQHQHDKGEHKHQ
jgi:nitrous oxide reductase accessory protein NosL